MTFLMDNKIGEFWECPKDARLLYRSKVANVQVWYIVENKLAPAVQALTG